MWVTLTDFEGHKSQVFVFIIKILSAHMLGTILVYRYFSWKCCLGLYLGHLDLLPRSQRSKVVYLLSAQYVGNKLTWDHQLWCVGTLYLSWKNCSGLYVGHLDLLPRSQSSSLSIHHKNAFWSICWEQTDL